MSRSQEYRQHRLSLSSQLKPAWSSVWLAIAIVFGGISVWDCTIQDLHGQPPAQPQSLPEHESPSELTLSQADARPDEDTEKRLREMDSTTQELEKELDQLKKDQAEREKKEKKAKEEEEEEEERKKKADKEKEEEKKKRDEEKKKNEDKFTFQIGGQLVMDMLWFSQGPESVAMVGNANDVFDTRRARIYMNGEMWDVWNYVMGFDFGQGTGDNGRPAFLDNYIGVQDLPVFGDLRVGHFFEPFMLERSGSNRNTMFIERSLADLFAPARNIGIMAHDQSDDERLWWGIGTFRGITDNFSNDAGDQSGQTIDVRFAWRPGYRPSDPCHYLHVGGAYSFRGAADGTLRYRTRPELSGNEDPVHLGTPSFVDTGILAAEHSQLWGGELLWTHGPLSIQGEMVASPVHLSSGEHVNFSGAYASVAYFLTGEYIPYNTEFAIVDRVKPNAPVFRRGSDIGQLGRGPGAWQIAARLSNVNLSDGSVSGGNLTNASFGLNWFLTPYHRMKFDYILSHLERGSNHSDASLFGLRFDMDF